MFGVSKRFRMSMRWVLALGFVGLVLSVGIVVLVLGFSSGVVNTRNLLNDKAVGLIQAIESRIDAQLHPVRQQANWIKRGVQTGALDPTDHDAFMNTLNAALAGTPQVTGIGMLYPDGTMTQADRDGHLYNSDDLSAEPWVQSLLSEAQKGGYKGFMTWMPPLWVPDIHQTVLALETALYRKDVYMGQLYQVVTVSDMSKNLMQMAEGTDFTPFILYDRQWIQAHPLMIDWRPDGDPGPKTQLLPFAKGSSPLPLLGGIDDIVLSKIWSDEARPLKLFRKNSEGVEGVHVEVMGEPNIILFKKLTQYGDKPWTVGAHGGKDVAGEEIFRLAHHAGWAVLFLILAVIGAMIIGRVLERPVQSMAVAANRVEAEDLENVPVLKGSFIREMDNAAQAFNAMVKDMRERHKIREVFGRYIPRTIASAILREQGRVQPQSSEATILFVDLAGFTAMSEQMKPEEIVAMLNDYFSAVVEAIERHGGIVTQFQGDAVLAIYNVPAPDPDHAVNALQSAIEIRKVVSEQTFAGHKLQCRIGLNTGDVVAGSVGASGRLSYTVHGDAVNLAARLEQLNKDHGTSILVSGETAGRINGHALKRIGAEPIRGKTRHVEIFTLETDNEADSTVQSELPTIH